MAKCFSAGGACGGQPNRYLRSLIRSDLEIPLYCRRLLKLVLKHEPDRRKPEKGFLLALGHALAHPFDMCYVLRINGGGTLCGAVNGSVRVCGVCVARECSISVCSCTLADVCMFMRRVRIRTRTCPARDFLNCLQRDACSKL